MEKFEPQHEKKEEEYLKIDPHSFEIFSALESAPIFKKCGLVTARQAITSEQIATILKDGFYETINTARKGDWVVKNSSREEYILTQEQFSNHYQQVEEGMYRPTGYCRAIQNPFAVPIEIEASWGEPQFGDENCMIADTCDEFGYPNKEPYLIARQAFEETYISI